MKFDIGSRFKEIRDLHNLSANKLGDALEIDPSTITKIERGNSLPSLKLLISFCDYFKISLSDFFQSKNSHDATFLTPELKELLDNAKNLTPEQIKAFSDAFKSLKKD